MLARGDGIRFTEHLNGDGAIIFAHPCKLALEGTRLEAAGPAVPIGPVPGVGENQEPRRRAQMHLAS